MPKPCNLAISFSANGLAGSAGRLAASLLIPLLTTNALAQATAQQPFPQTPLVRTGANLVLVDVVVTDHGAPVHSLDRAQFHLQEDGHAQAITAFDEHLPPATSSAAATRPALPPHMYTNVPEYPPASAVNVVLLDGLNTSQGNQMDVRRQMIEFLGKVQPGTPMAIFTLASRLRMVTGFTTDTAELARAVSGKRVATAPAALLGSQSTQAGDAAVSDLNDETKSVAAIARAFNLVKALQQFEEDQAAAQTDQRVKMTLEAMQQLARYLAGIPGRKNLIWFSGSFPIALTPQDSGADPLRNMRNYEADVHQTAELLGTARVAVYPVDARGLMTLPSADILRASLPNSSNIRSPGAADLHGAAQQMQEHSSMQQIAHETGGQEFYDTNALKEALAAAIADGSSYYTIGYTPPTGAPNGRFHKIQVTVDGREYQLAYRRGYYAAQAPKSGPDSLAVLATLHGAPPATEIPFEARVLPATDPGFKDAQLPTGPAGDLTGSLKGPLKRFVVDLKLDAHALQFDPMPDGEMHMKTEFILVAYDGDGRRINVVDRGILVNLKPAQMESAYKSGLRSRLLIDLPVGSFSLRIAVYDVTASRTGAVEVPITVSGTDL